MAYWRHLILLLAFFFPLLFTPTLSKTLKRDGTLNPWDVYAVSIVGPFPFAVTNLLDLRRLDLHNNNKLTGPIPPQIARLKLLKILHNQFSGTIPDAFYKHPFLKEMYMEGNAFWEVVNPIGVHKVLEVTDTDFLV